MDLKELKSWIGSLDLGLSYRSIILIEDGHVNPSEKGDFLTNKSDLEI
jgi:hypothetical protein